MEIVHSFRFRNFNTSGWEFFGHALCPTCWRNAFARVKPVKRPVYNAIMWSISFQNNQFENLQMTSILEQISSPWTLCFPISALTKENFQYIDCASACFTLWTIDFPYQFKWTVLRFYLRMCLCLFWIYILFRKPTELRRQLLKCVVVNRFFFFSVFISSGYSSTLTRPKAYL